MNDVSPLISVIIPVYNTEKETPTCLQSMLAQTYSNFELIVVDDGSTDNSGLICDTFAAKDQRVKVVHTTNAGVSAARNTALDISRGEYIAFVDSDDYVSPNFLEVLLHQCVVNDADISMCAWQTYVDGENEEIHIPIQNSCVLSADEAFYQVLRNGGVQGYLWNKLFRASFFSPKGEHLRFNEKVLICEDLLLVCQAIKNCGSCAYVPVPLYHYNMRLDSAMRIWDGRRMTQIQAYDEIIRLSSDMSDKCQSVAREQYLSTALYLTGHLKNQGNKEAAKSIHNRARRLFLPVEHDKNVSLKAKIKYAVMMIAPACSLRLWTKLKRRYRLSWSWPSNT